MPGNCFEVIDIDAIETNPCKFCRQLDGYYCPCDRYLKWQEGTKAMIEISATEFNIKCKWIDSKHVLYYNKTYKVLGYYNKMMKLAEI